jgi:hypothetical protein
MDQGDDARALLERIPWVRPVGNHLARRGDSQAGANRHRLQALPEGPEGVGAGGSATGGQAQHLRDPFFSGFSEGLGYVPKSLSEFTVEGFSRQLEWLDERPDSTAKSYRYLRRFYKRVIDLLPEGQGQFTFATGLPPQLLDHHHLFEFWRKGYRGVLHNPLDPVPDNDRWFLFPSRDELARTNVSPIPAAMDLSYDDADMRRVLKEWLWRECDNVYYVRRLAPRLKRFFDVVRESPGWAPPIREIGLRPSSSTSLQGPRRSGRPESGTRRGG